MILLCTQHINRMHISFLPWHYIFFFLYAIHVWNCYTLNAYIYTYVYTCTQPVPSEVKLLKKECFNRWYGLTPYYAALTLSRLPFQVSLICFCIWGQRKLIEFFHAYIKQILFNMIFLVLTYWMSGLPSEYFRFALYALVGIIVAFVAESLGLAIGAAFSITVSTY